MDLLERRRAWLRRAAWLGAVLVLGIASLSAFIRLSQAGLGCEPWPQCYGSRLRDAQQGRAPSAVDSIAVTAARVAHRLLAVSALVVALAMVVLSFASRPWLAREGALALGLVALAVGLAVLGRWSAGSRVPAVAMGNLLGGFGMLALCVRLTAPAADGPRLAWRRWAWLAVALLLVQAGLGAWLSASFARLSCAGIDDCIAAARASGWSWSELAPWKEVVFDPAATRPHPGGALVQLLHRGSAWLVLAVLVPLGVAALRGPMRWSGALLLGLLALQLALGLQMGAGSLPLGLALAHNVAAALLIAVAVRMA